MKPTTVLQETIYLALRIDNDERNEVALKEFQYKTYLRRGEQVAADILYKQFGDHHGRA